jgi:hypothetical protein
VLSWEAAAQGDFLMTDGLTYLNTGTIGPSLDAPRRHFRGTVIVGKDLLET